LPDNRAGISLYFDARCVYAAELTKKNGKSFLKRLTCTEILPTVDASSKKEAFKAAVVETVEKTGLKQATVTLALPGSESIIRHFELPSMPAREVASAVRFEAQKYMPFEIKDLSYDFESFPDTKKKNIKIVFLAARKSLIESLLQVLSAAGLLVSAIEPDALSILRLEMLQPREKKDEVLALINLRDDGSFDVVVKKNKMILMARTGAFTPPALLEPSGFGRDFESFAKESVLSFSYFSKNFRNEEIKRIFLSTDLAYNATQWAEGLHSKFDVPVQEWTPSGGLFSKTEHVSPGMIFSIGAALRPPQTRFNFLKKKVPDLALGLGRENLKAEPPLEAQKKILIHWALAGAATAFVCVLVLHALFIPKIISAKRTVENMKKDQAQTAGSKAAFSKDELSDAKRQLDFKRSFLSSLMTGRLFWTEKLGAIARTTPEVIQLTSIDVSDIEDKNGVSTLNLKIEGVILGGGAPGVEMAAAQGFVERLRTNAEFMKGLDTVLLSQVRNVSGRESGREALMSFVVECASKRKAGAA